jgi:hypothetical protein
MSSPSFEIPPPPPSEPTGFPATWRRVVSDPQGFFSEMPLADGLGAPLGFLAVCAGLAGLGTLVVSWSLWTALGTALALIVLALWHAVVLTVVAQQLFDGRAGFEPTCRVVAYGFAPGVFLWVPRLAVIAALWILFLQVRGVERVHVLDAPRAVLAVVVAAAASTLVVLGLRGGLW